MPGRLPATADGGRNSGHQREPRAGGLARPPPATADGRRNRGHQRNHELGLPARPPPTADGRRNRGHQGNHELGLPARSDLPNDVAIKETPCRRAHSTLLHKPLSLAHPRARPSRPSIAPVHRARPSPSPTWGLRQGRDANRINRQEAKGAKDAGISAHPPPTPQPVDGPHGGTESTAETPRTLALLILGPRSPASRPSMVPTANRMDRQDAKDAAIPRSSVPRLSMFAVAERNEPPRRPMARRMPPLLLSCRDRRRHGR